MSAAAFATTIKLNINAESAKEPLFVSIINKGLYVKNVAVAADVSTICFAIGVKDAELVLDF